MLLVTINTIHYNNIIGSNTPIIGNNTTLHTIETLMVTIQHYYYYIVGKNTTLRDTIILGSDYMTVQYRHARSTVMVQYHHARSTLTVLYCHARSTLTVLYCHTRSTMTVLFGTFCLTHIIQNSFYGELIMIMYSSTKLKTLIVESMLIVQSQLFVQRPLSFCFVLFVFVI